MEDAVSVRESIGENIVRCWSSVRLGGEEVTSLVSNNFTAGAAV